MCFPRAAVFPVRWGERGGISVPRLTPMGDFRAPCGDLTRAAQTLRDAYSCRFPRTWRAWRLRWESSGGGESALALVWWQRIRDGAWARLLGCSVFMAALVCVVWFTAIGAHACGNWAHRRGRNMQALATRSCLHLLCRILQVLLCRSVLSVLLVVQTPSLAIALAYWVVWCAARNSSLAHGPGCRFWTCAFYTVTCFWCGVPANCVLHCAVFLWIMPSSCLWWAPKVGQAAQFAKLEQFVSVHADLLAQRHRDRPCEEPSPSALVLFLSTLRTKPREQELLYKFLMRLKAQSGGLTGEATRCLDRIWGIVSSAASQAASGEPASSSRR